MKVRTLIVSLLLLATSNAVATHEADPEVSDAAGDVDAQHLVTLDQKNELGPLTQDQAEQIGDILDAWVHHESADSFVLAVEIAEIIQHNETETPLAELWLHFTTMSDDYRAVARLAVPQPNTPVGASFELVRNRETPKPIFGSIATDTDTVFFTIPKDMVRNPQPGDTLTRFYATSHLANTELMTLDYAPGVESIDPETFDPMNPVLPGGAKYGRDYTFGDFDGAVAANLFTTVTPTNLELTSGEQGTVSISIKNNAAEADSVTFSLGSVPSGWDARFDSTELDVEPGQSRLTMLRVTPNAAASGQSLITLKVVSELGSDEDVALSVRAVPPADQGSGAGTGTGGGSDEGTDADGSTAAGGDTTGTGDASDDGAHTGRVTDRVGPGGTSGDASDEQGNDSPAPGVLVLVSIIGVLALAAGGRRR